MNFTTVHLCATDDTGHLHTTLKETDRCEGHLLTAMMCLLMAAFALPAQGQDKVDIKKKPPSREERVKHLLH